MTTRVDKMWKAFLDAYGNRIEIEYGKSPPDYWCMAVAPLTDQEFERGLQRLRDDPPPQRPNAIEFCDLCRPARRPRYRGPLNSAQDRAKYFAVPKPASREVIDRTLARIRKRLAEANPNPSPRTNGAHTDVQNDRPRDHERTQKGG